MGVENYAIGGTRIFFNNNGHDGAAGDGFLDLGNLTTVNFTSEITKLPHTAFIAATLSRSKDLEIVTDQSFGLTCNMDELGAEQWNLVSSGNGTTTNTQAGGTPTNERHLAPLLLDRSFFADETNISALTVTGTGGTPTYATTDYTLVNAVTSEIKILSTGIITSALPLFINYTSAARTVEQISPGADLVLQGSARVHYQAQNGQDMTWLLNNCIVSVEGDTTLGSEAFSEAVLTLSAIVDKVVDTTNPFGLRTVG